MEIDKSHTDADEVADASVGVAAGLAGAITITTAAKAATKATTKKIVGIGVFVTAGYAIAETIEAASNKKLSGTERTVLAVSAFGVGAQETVGSIVPFGGDALREAGRGALIAVGCKTCEKLDLSDIRVLVEAGSEQLSSKPPAKNGNVRGSYAPVEIKSDIALPRDFINASNPALITTLVSFNPNTTWNPQMKADNSYTEPYAVRKQYIGNPTTALPDMF